MTGFEPAKGNPTGPQPALLDHSSTPAHTYLICMSMQDVGFEPTRGINPIAFETIPIVHSGNPAEKYRYFSVVDLCIFSYLVCNSLNVDDRIRTCDACAIGPKPIPFVRLDTST